MASAAKDYNNLTSKLYYLGKNANTTGKDSNIAALSCCWLFVDAVCRKEPEKGLRLKFKVNHRQSP